MKFLKLLLCSLLISSGPGLAQSGHEGHDHGTKTGDNKQTYICPMHPNIKQNEPGTCPICGMDLVTLDEGDSGNEPKMSSEKPSSSLGGNEDHNHEQMYTCPMHPNIKQNEPGTCPICGMDLVPIKTETSMGSMNEESIKISQASRRLAGIETEKVQKTTAYQNISAVGSIDFDEGRISTIAAYVDGRIEKLYANYTGVKVKKDEHLAEFYSPALYSAQVEYLQAGSALWKMRDSQLSSTLSTQRALLINAERKLKELGMSEPQIKALKKTRIVLLLIRRLELFALESKYPIPTESLDQGILPMLLFLFQSGRVEQALKPMIQNLLASTYLLCTHRKQVTNLESVRFVGWSLFLLKSLDIRQTKETLKKS